MTRAEKKIKTRREVFKAAIKLFNVHGIEKTKISDIAKEAHVSVGTFYVHFKSKEDIISAIYYEDFNNFMNFNIQQVEKRNLNLKEILLEIGILELRFAKKVGLEITTAAFIANLQTNIEMPGNHFGKRTFSLKIKKMLSKLAVGTSKNSEILFQEFETIVRGTMLTWCFSNGAVNMVSLGTPLLENYLNNL